MQMPDVRLRMHRRVAFAVEVGWSWLVVELSLRRFGFARTLRRTARHASCRPDAGDRAAASSLVRRVDRVCEAAGIRNCLRRTLVARSMLQRRGIEPNLRIGTDTTSGILRAHAWLELAGAPVVAASALGFEPLPPYAPLSSEQQWGPVHFRYRRTSLRSQRD